VSTELLIIGEQLSPGQTHGIGPCPGPANAYEGPVGFFDPDRSDGNSKEVRAVRRVGAACAALNLAAFEWTIPEQVAAAAKGYSGAEIDAAVQTAL